MKSNKLLKITEFGKIGSISRKMLIHYDKVGVLKPVYVNPETNYRYYSIEQIANLTMIKSLQAVGVSLGEIKEKYKGSSIEEYIKNLRKEEEIIESKFIELEKSKKIITDKLACLEEILDLDSRLEFKIKTFPERHVILSPLKEKSFEEATRIMYNLKNEVLKRDFIVVGELAGVKRYPKKKSGQNESFLGLFSVNKIELDGAFDFEFKAGEYLCFYKEGFALEEENFEIIDTWCEKNGYEAESRVLLIPVLLPFLDLERKLYNVQVKIKNIR
jgi:DNA-binding transcriptional MerR regulator